MIAILLLSIFTLVAYVLQSLFSVHAAEKY